VFRKHAGFAPARQSLLGFRLRSPLSSVEEPCPLSLQTVFLNTKPDPLHITDVGAASMSERSELRSRREERMEMALKIRLGARLFSQNLF